MRVICELDIGNDEDYPNTKIELQGDPFQSSGFIHLTVGGHTYEVRPQELIEAVDRVRSDNV